MPGPPTGIRLDLDPAAALRRLDNEVVINAGTGLQVILLPDGLPSITGPGPALALTAGLPDERTVFVQTSWAQWRDTTARIAAALGETSTDGEHRPV